MVYSTHWTTYLLYACRTWHSTISSMPDMRRMLHDAGQRPDAAGISSARGRRRFRFRHGEIQKDGFDQFVQPYEHSYNTSKSQYMATISWSASQLYKLTGKPSYADIAAEYIRYTLDCQRTEPLKDKDGTRGFFYRDKSRNPSYITYTSRASRSICRPW